MHPTDKIEKKMILFLYNDNILQAGADRILKHLRHNFRNITKSQMEKRLQYLEREGLIKDLERYEKKKMYILTDKCKQEYPQKMLKLHKANA